MSELFLDLEEETVKAEITRRKARRVLVQLPEGLRDIAYRIRDLIEGMGAEVFISADPCYGACDPYPPEVESLKVDLMIHYGHTRLFQDKNVPTIYIEAKSKRSIKEAVKAALPLLEEFSSVGLVTTAQHWSKIEEAKEVLTSSGKEVLIGDVGGFLHPGQIIGCDCSNAKRISDQVEAFLVVAGGRFHALGVGLTTMKPTFVADPFERRAYSIEEDIKRMIKKRWACISAMEKAEKIGVLVGLRSGQRRLDLALRIKEKLERKGKRVILLATREISPMTLDQFVEAEAFVNTACPRVSLDDISRFRKPLLTVNEALVVLGEKSWEELCEEGWFEDLTWRRP